MIAELVNSPDAIVSVRSAAEDNDVPYSFARSIQHELVRAGIITSLRGSRGGMRLAVDPQQVSLLAVIEAVQGPISLAQCDDPSCATECPNKSVCHFNPIWRGARELLTSYFSKITLADAVKGLDASKARGIESRCTAEVARISAELVVGRCCGSCGGAAGAGAKAANGGSASMASDCSGGMADDGTDGLDANGAATDASGAPELS